MADEKKNEINSLDDGSLDKVAGGRPAVPTVTPPTTAVCYGCKKEKSLDQMSLELIGGAYRRVCFTCLGLR